MLSCMVGGGGIDGAIHHRAGAQLYEYCRSLGSYPRCKIGSTVKTPGFDLPARWILHTVGPRQADRVALQSCFESLLSHVNGTDLRSVALCGVATGIFGFPLREFFAVAMGTVRAWLGNEVNRAKVDCLIFVVFRGDELDEYRHAMQQWFPVGRFGQSDDQEADGDAAGISGRCCSEGGPAPGLTRKHDGGAAAVLPEAVPVCTAASDPPEGDHAASKRGTGVCSGPHVTLGLGVPDDAAVGCQEASGAPGMTVARSMPESVPPDAAPG